MLIRGEKPTSVFGLTRNDENSATTALAWCIEKVPALRLEVLRLLGVDDDIELAIRNQAYDNDRGFTDLELTSGTALHAIIEAKVGWQVATLGQLERYVPRLASSPARHRLLVSVSAADAFGAKRHLPSNVAGIPVKHISWSDFEAAARRAMSATRSPLDRLWLDQLSAHLKGYTMTSSIFDARAYVVSISRDRMKEDNPLTWIDVIEQQQRYFHPVGTKGWPNIPPAYIGFRWRAQFRSVHFVEHFCITERLQDVDPRWPDTTSPHFVYSLGPAMAPAKPMPLGAIHPSMRNWISLDLLLSGISEDYGDAVGRMRLRNESAGGTGE